MKSINFLPDSYVCKQTRERWRLGQIGMIILAAVGVALYMFNSHQGLASTDAYVQKLEVEIIAARKQMTEFHELQQEHAVLMYELRIQRELALPLRHSQIIAAIGEVFPESVMLNSLKITTTDVMNKFTGGQIPGRQRGRKQTDIESPDGALLVVEMKGLAANAQDISVLHTVLDDHPLFCDVKTHYSRSTQVNDLIGHAFHLSMAIPLNCDFRPVQPNQLADVGTIQPQSNEESHAIVDQEVADAH